ncbi:MAG: DUF3995 domain-containing protein [Flammeovirgaceae bacterium]
MLGLANAFILILLALIHFYWAMGGIWGKEKSVPSTVSGTQLFNPGIVATSVVGIGLFTFALIELGRAGWILRSFPPEIFRFGNHFITLIFFVRFVGDFRYVGIFKKVIGTEFSKNDTRYFSPLCFVISSLSLSLNL